MRGLQLAIALAAGWGFIGTGLFLWARRPDNQIGPLMTLVGFLWFVSQLSVSNLPLLFTVGNALGSVYVAATMQLVLSYPSGELTERRDRIVVAIAYAITTIGLLLMGLFLDPADDGCAECPDNLALVSPNADVAAVFDAVFSFVAVVLLGIVIATLVRRWREAGPGRATLLGPVYLLIGLLLTMLVMALAVDLFSAPDWVETAFFIAGVACFAAMPYAFLGALARNRLVDATVLEAENVRLDAELRARVEKLRASRQRIVEAGVAERRRIERDLHDGAQQRLVSLALDLRLARSQVRDDPDAAERLLDGAAEELGRALAELRELARGIHPAVSAIAVSRLRSRRSPVVRRCRSSCAAVATRVCRRPSSRRLASSSPRRSPTSPSTPRQRRRRWSCGVRTARSRWRSATTASAAPIRPPAAASAGWPTVSRRSTAASTSSRALARAPR